MAYRKLNLDRDKIDQCRNIAARIVTPVQKYIDRHSTTSIERSVLRVFGVEGELDGEPLVNHVVDGIERDHLRKGIAWWFGKAMAHTGLKPQDLAHELANKRFSLKDIPNVPRDRVVTARAGARSKRTGGLSDIRHGRIPFSPLHWRVAPVA